MAEKSNEVAAILDGMAAEMAHELRRHFGGLKETAVASDAAAVDKVSRAMAAIGKANLIIRAVAAAEDKQEEERQVRRSSRMDQMEMDDITPAELEQRAAELRARYDRILALIEAKCPKLGGRPVEPDRNVAEGGALRAA